jgi:ABC-2 type transport system ATP-binding protein
MERCGLVEVRRKLIGSLSRGYRQRVGLAQAILHNPPVLILDEPTVGLDPRQIIEVRELIRGLAGDHTVLLSTHILPEVSMLCARVAIIDHGRLVAEDTPENLAQRERGGERLLVTVEGDAAVADRLRSVPGVVDVAADDRSVGVWVSGCVGESQNLTHTPTHPHTHTPPLRFRLQTAPGDEAQARRVRREVASAVVSGGDGLLELAAERLTLEDVFVRLVTTEA